MTDSDLCWMHENAVCSKNLCIWNPLLDESDNNENLYASWEILWNKLHTSLWVLTSALYIEPDRNHNSDHTTKMVKIVRLIRTQADYCAFANANCSRQWREILKKCICLLGSGGATRGDQIQWRAFRNPQWTQKEHQACVTNQRCINYAAQHSHHFNCLFKCNCLYEDRFSYYISMNHLK
jgi:hypothetical protein